MNPEKEPGLKRTLSPLMLWGLGVGYVISGMYFGWNLGLEKGGTLGLGLATLLIILLYTTFTFSYTELACAIPKAGGGFDYAGRALGPTWGFVAGMAQTIEFIFAPPAIAFAIGAYFNLFFPQIPIISIAIASYFLFTALNAYGVKAAAIFELTITILAVGELLLFAGITLPAFELKHLQSNPLPHGWSGFFAAIPFAIWFFLGIEGVANVAEEAINPQKTILIGFGSAILTLVLLCMLTFFSSIGVNGWESIVYQADGSLSDSPLPLALKHVVGDSNLLYHLLISVGLFGLIASFNGIILAAGRSTYELGKVKAAPPFLGRVHSKFQTPTNALFINMTLGIMALLTGKTAEIITISVFGALTLYLISMVSILALRRNEPDLERPFKTPFFPYFPWIALIIAAISMISMMYYNPVQAGIYFLILLGTSIIYRFFGPKLTHKP
ncbi:ethanolamine permease [Aquirufa nivalisilvae]|uniref:Putative transporter n=1 Tax=Aquirufa nivalisilvae TaxID=2516557 RepID=A0A2S2DWQ2_9BACT|nr:ethanolamine permease [Aquirufa nivalisilvae]AWL09722.1 putative transporter [Aquirufa nivalisilvae]MCZ2480347.1 ethanolamine permease [Aquirufa nivalisilvae]MCZ2482580.1 ethanolamine permease [Aquirufa nivalisilvae]